VSEYLIAVILGIVEGLTEYLPISSTGHLILTGEALKFTGSKAHSFEVIIQVGAILAVVILFRDRFLRLIPGMFDLSQVYDKGLQGSAGVFKLGMVTLPAVVMGLLLKDTIKAHLFNPLSVAVAFAVGAIVILLVDRRSGESPGKTIEELTWKESFLIGCIQCAALWPGMSRSASAIIGGMFVGLNRKAAAEFSFLAAVPVLAAAAVKESLDAVKTFSAGDIELICIGLVVSFVTALVTVRWFIGFVSRVSLRPFAWYRLLVALVVVLMLGQGMLKSDTGATPSEDSAISVKE